MRGSHRRRRNRRLATATFTLTSLVLSIFLMFGQLGLLAASAADRDRDGAFESNTDVVSTGDAGSLVGSSGGGGLGGPQIQTRDEAAGFRPLGPGDSVSTDFVAVEPSDYNHTTGVGGDSTDTRPELEADDFFCNDIVVFLYEVDADGIDAGDQVSLDVDLFFNHNGSNSQPFGYDQFVSTALDTADPNYTDTGTAAGLTSTSNNNGTDSNGDPSVTVNLQITGVNLDDHIWGRIKIRLGHCGPGDVPPPSNVQSGVDDVDAVDQAGAGVSTGGGTQTIPLKIDADQPTITLIKDIVGTPPDQGKFDLRIEGTVVADDVGDGGTSGAQTVLAGTYTIDELAGTGTSLSNYSSSVSCVLGTQTPITESDTSIELTVADGEDWICTFTNTAGAPSVSIAKTGASTVTAGSNIIWTITVSNTGNAPATNVLVTDTLPAGFTFVSSNPDNSTNPTPPFCSHSSGTVSCSLGTIAASGQAQITITATAPNTCGPFQNSAAGTFGPNNTAMTNSPATARGDVTGCGPSLTINKAGPATVQQGTSITYTVTVTNSGNASAFDVQISDAVPSPLTNPVGTPSQGSCQTTGNTVNCSLGTIAGGGGSATISITAGVPAGQCVQIQNQATGTFALEVEGEPQTIQASGVLTTQITGCGAPGAPALSVTKTADAAVVTPPSPVGFLITVSNTGSADANNVTLSDTIPAMPGVTWSINGGTGAAQCTLTGNSLSCNFGTLSAGQSKTVHIQSTATSTASCGTFTNVAVANSSNAGSATAQATVEVDCPPGIDIVKNGPATAYVGDTITYTFDVTLEAGSDPLSNVVLTDPNCDPGTLTGPTGDDGDNVLEQGETWHYTCTHEVTDTDPDPLPNTATVCSGTVCDSDDHVVDILHPAIRIVKTANPDSGSPGEVISYRYRITNTGDVTLFDITVDDDVVGHICDIAVLEPGESAVCTAEFTIPANANIEITNVVVAEGEDENGRDVSDEDEETIDIILGETVTPTVTPPGGVAFTGAGGLVPLAGLALLMLTLGSGLLWAGRRRGSGDA